MESRMILPETTDNRPTRLFRSLVGTNPGIQKVREAIQQVAKTDVNVLITGESGSGKEVVARNIHYFSERANKPFIPVNCGAIPAELLESELFGHEKGAFTGAIATRIGKFEAAQGGTLFLDEIGDMPSHMQIKLLRVLQEKTFERVGSNKTIHADVRIISATHCNLEEAIIHGKFREDLYFRLNVFPIEVPALRDRKEDIPLLLNELVKRVESDGKGCIRLSPSAVTALTLYPWPGNIRELANLVERLTVLSPDKTIEAKDLPEKYTSHGHMPVTPLPAEGIDLKDYLTQLEINFIEQALKESKGVIARAAERLGMRRTTLIEKIKKYKLQKKTAKSEIS